MCLAGRYAVLREQACIEASSLNNVFVVVKVRDVIDFENEGVAAVRPWVGSFPNPVDQSQEHLGRRAPILPRTFQVLA